MTTTADTDGFLTEDDSDAKYFQIYVPSWGTDGSNNALSSFLRIGATVTNPSTAWASTLLAQNGKKLFDSYGCYQCHDHDGHGGVGARLALH